MKMAVRRYLPISLPVPVWFRVWHVKMAIVIANDWEPYSHALNHAVLACTDAPAFKELVAIRKQLII